MDESLWGLDLQILKCCSSHYCWKGLDIIRSWSMASNRDVSVPNICEMQRAWSAQFYKMSGQKGIAFSIPIHRYSVTILLCCYAVCCSSLFFLIISCFQRGSPRCLTEQCVCRPPRCWPLIRQLCVGNDLRVGWRSGHYLAVSVARFMFVIPEYAKYQRRKERQAERHVL